MPSEARSPATRFLGLTEASELALPCYKNWLMDEEPHHLTPRHFHVFGHLVSTYAKVEHGMKLLITRFAGMPDEAGFILFEPYSALDICNVISGLVSSYDLPEGIETKLIEAVSEFKSFAPLRNAIAHDLWTEGSRPASIKPMRIDVRSGKSLRIRGMDDSERDWTFPELEAEVSRMSTLHGALIKLVREIQDEGKPVSVRQKSESGCVERFMRLPLPSDGVL